MELAERYIYKIWEKQSFSEAAKELYISQPSLSATVARVEKNLCFRIFNRSTIPLSLTPQGRIYMDFLEEILISESNMKQRISAMGDMKSGTISIGGQIYTAIHLIPELCGAFYKKYPEVGITIDLGGIGAIDNLFEKVKKNMLDIVLAYDYDPHEFEGIPLLEERLIFVAHKDMEGAQELSKYAITREEIINNHIPSEKEIEDFSIFSNIKFVKNRETSNTSQRMTKILGEHNLAPHIVINVRQIGILYDLMKAGVGAVMVNDYLIKNSPQKADELLYIVPKSPHSHRTLYIVKKKGTHLSPITEKFVSEALKLCSKASHDLVDIDNAK